MRPAVAGYRVEVDKTVRLFLVCKVLPCPGLLVTGLGRPRSARGPGSDGAGPGAERQAGVFPMSRRKIAAYLRVNFSPGFLAQRVGGKPRRDALIAGTWRAHTASLRSSSAWWEWREGRTGV